MQIYFLQVDKVVFWHINDNLLLNILVVKNLVHCGDCTARNCLATLIVVACQNVNYIWHQKRFEFSNSTINPHLFVVLIMLICTYIINSPHLFVVLLILIPPSLTSIISLLYSLSILLPPSLTSIFSLLYSLYFYLHH